MNGLLIGRFQPFHLGHLEALQFALSVASNVYVPAPTPVKFSIVPTTADEASVQL